MHDPRWQNQRIKLATTLLSINLFLQALTFFVKYVQHKYTTTEGVMTIQTTYTQTRAN